LKGRNEEENKEKRGKDKERKHDRALLPTAIDVGCCIITVSHPWNVSRSVSFVLP
jgi:hypothetical protein